MGMKAGFTSPLSHGHTDFLMVRWFSSLMSISSEDGDFQLLLGTVNPVPKKSNIFLHLFPSIYCCIGTLHKSHNKHPVHGSYFEGSDFLFLLES